MMINETYTLANEVKIPKLGLGTWMIADDKVGAAVQEAVKLGYRHIDTAQAYANERGVGEGVRACGLPREALFITTKLAAEIKSYEGAAAAIDESLNKLGLESIDLLLIHSPKPWYEFHKEDRFLEGNREAWRAMEDAYKAGKLRAIGVSNFEREDLENILSSCTIKPHVNQVLAHISNTPAELISFCQEQGILVEAYSPIAHGELMKNEQIKAVAEKYGASIPQLAIRYTLQLGLLPLPKTANPAHMQSNAEVNFQISDEDMELLKNLPRIKDYGAASGMPVFGGVLG